MKIRIHKGRDDMAVLGTPSGTIEILKKYNFTFQKRYGQNFLIDTHILDKIVEASFVTKGLFRPGLNNF